MPAEPLRTEPSTSRTLDESTSKQLVAACGLTVAAEVVGTDPAELVAAADAMGYPVVAKLCGDQIAHKSERGLVRLGLSDSTALRGAIDELLAAARPEDGDVAVLVAEMVWGNRELIAGLHRDAQFGLTVMLGVGGILAEAIGDVAFRLVPLDEIDADEMIDDLTSQSLFGALRGEPPVDRAAVRDVVLGLARLGEERPDIVSVDVNPLIVVDGVPVAVDALVEVAS